MQIGIYGMGGGGGGEGRDEWGSNEPTLSTYIYTHLYTQHSLRMC